MSKDDKELAAARWKAVEAFLGYGGVSRLARDIGVLIVCRADLRPGSKRYGRCYLSEVSMATRLGTTVRSVARAKKELKAKGLVGYQSHAGPSHTTLYTPDWQLLIDMAGEIEASAKAAVVAAPKRPNRGSQHDASVMLEGADGSTQHDKNGNQHAASVMFVHDASVMGSSSNTSSTRSSSTAACAAAPDGAAPAPKDHEGAMKETSPRQPSRFYPKLFATFEGDPEISRLLEGMGIDRQHEASKLLALEGPEAAAAFVKEQAS